MSKRKVYFSYALCKLLKPCAIPHNNAWFPFLWCLCQALPGKHHAIPKSKFTYRAPCGWEGSVNRSHCSSTSPFAATNSPSFLPTPTGLCLHHLNAAKFWSPARVRSIPAPHMGQLKEKERKNMYRKP